MDIVALAPIVLLVVAFYFLLIRPQKQRQRAILCCTNETWKHALRYGWPCRCSAYQRPRAGAAKGRPARAPLRVIW